MIWILKSEPIKFLHFPHCSPEMSHIFQAWFKQAWQVLGAQCLWALHAYCQLWKSIPWEQHKIGTETINPQSLSCSAHAGAQACSAPAAWTWWGSPRVGWSQRSCGTENTTSLLNVRRGERPPTEFAFGPIECRKIRLDRLSNKKWASGGQWPSLLIFQVSFNGSPGNL